MKPVRSPLQYSSLHGLFQESKARSPSHVSTCLHVYIKFQEKAVKLQFIKTTVSFHSDFPSQDILLVYVELEGPWAFWNPVKGKLSWRYIYLVFSGMSAISRCPRVGNASTNMLNPLCWLTWHHVKKIRGQRLYCEWMCSRVPRTSGMWAMTRQAWNAWSQS